MSDMSYYHHYGVIDNSRHPSWSKLHVVARMLPWFDAVVWLDADAIILRPFRWLVETACEKSEITMFDQPRTKTLNAGIGIFRRKGSALTTIGEAYFGNPMSWHAPWWEQEAFMQIGWQDRPAKLNLLPHDNIIDYGDDRPHHSSDDFFFHPYGPGSKLAKINNKILSNEAKAASCPPNQTSVAKTTSVSNAAAKDSQAAVAAK